MLPYTSQGPLQLDWGHMTSSGQWGVSGSHFLAEAVKNQSTSSILPFLAGMALEITYSRWNSYKMKKGCWVHIGISRLANKLTLY